MKVNLTKTEFLKQESEYFGYLLTPIGIKPEKEYSHET